MATKTLVTLRVLPTRNPKLALLLSLLWPGAGQIYNGQVRQGVVLTLLYALSLLLVISGSPLGFVMAVVLVVYGAANAHSVADHYERWIGGPQKRCPHCGESIQAAANSCRLCGSGWNGFGKSSWRDTASPDTGERPSQLSRSEL